MNTIDAAPKEAVERLWQTARFLPESARLLGTRYRPLFLAHARECEPSGDNATVADALSFIQFMAGQERVALLEHEKSALRSDFKRLRRRFKLRRSGTLVLAVEKWKILQWLSF